MSHWINRPSITPWQMFFWAFIAIQLYRPVSYFVQRWASYEVPDANNWPSILWDVGMNLSGMLAVAILVTLVANLESFWRRWAGTTNI